MHLGETRRASQGLQAQWSEVERFCLDQRILEAFLSFGNESVVRLEHRNTDFRSGGKGPGACILRGEIDLESTSEREPV